MMKRDAKGVVFLARVLCALSVVAAVLGAVVFFAGMNQLGNLAGTQWILIAILLGIFSGNLHQCGVCYGKGSSCKCSGDAHVQQ